ncbi:MAG: hypothetical protein HYZ45_03350 [Burkholderiales bacterium]|nr:hypothetical protein [Burkholderiales bacterium]
MFEAVAKRAVAFRRVGKLPTKTLIILSIHIGLDHLTTCFSQLLGGTVAHFWWASRPEDDERHAAHPYVFHFRDSLLRERAGVKRRRLAIRLVEQKITIFSLKMAACRRILR